MTDLNKLTYSLPKRLDEAVKSELAKWQAENKVNKLWQRDASLWTGADEGKWLDWLSIVDDELLDIELLQKLANEVKSSNFSHVLLLGMGGSSLCPEVMAKTFGKVHDYPQLLILDSTDPSQICSIEESVKLSHTLFIVSSKSGTTLEPNSYMQYFLARMAEVVGPDNVGKHFIAVTDPDSTLEQVALRQGFRNIFSGVKGIGGRYSALSNFGMVPAAVMGVDVAKFLCHTQAMTAACRPSIKTEENSGLVLGIILGVLNKLGRDKVTIVTSPQIYDLGAWLEQLLAESTGKQGRGIIPIDREWIGPVNVYGEDRIFVYLRLESGFDQEQDKAVEALKIAGHPVVHIAVRDLYNLGQEFFRWEIATAVAGSILEINAFDQPDVEASKIATRKLTSLYEKLGSLPSETPIGEDSGIKLFADQQNAQALNAAVAKGRTLKDYLKAHLERLKKGDYFAILAYIEMTDGNEGRLQKMRASVRNTKKVATCLGFGPRFLHSTGQAYKGGPNTGVFLQVTCDDKNDLPVPGQTYTFGVVKAAQAQGDFDVLAERERRVLRVHLGKDVSAGLKCLNDALLMALEE